MTNHTAVTLLVLINIIWGISFAVIKQALLYMPPATLAAIRFFIGGIVLVFFTSKSAFRRSKQDWRDAALIGILGITLTYLLNFWGLQKTTATKAAIETSLEPIALVLLAHLLLDEPFQNKTAIALVISMLGTFILLFAGKGASKIYSEIINGGEAAGDIMILVSVFLAGAYTIFAKPLSIRVGAIWTTAVSSLIGSILLVPAAIWELYRGYVIEWNWELIAALLFLGLLCTALAFGIWNVVSTHSSATAMAVTLNIQPLTGIIIGRVWMNETMSFLDYIGAFLILLGVSLVSLKSENVAKDIEPTFI